MAKRTKAAVVEPEEEIEDEVEDEVELEDDEEEDAPTKKKRGGAQAEVTFGASDLAAHCSKVVGKTITPRDIRVLLRKMARSGRLNRDIIAGNRARYDWPKGLEDPEVKRVIKAVKGGELEQGKKEALDALKARKAEKDATAKKDSPKSTGKKGKKTAPPPPVDEDEEFEDLEDDDEE